MANNESLKMHLKMLKELFPKEHKHFRISQAATDQLTCQFVDGMGNKYDIHATIPVIFMNCLFGSVISVALMVSQNDFFCWLSINYLSMKLHQ